jgi:hypothetical protein
MATDVEIANRALVELGLSNKRISALSDSTREAEAINAIFSDLRDDVVSASAWNFATRRVLLAEAFSAIDISAISWSSDTVSVTTSTNHGFAVGDTVKIADVDPTSYNGSYRVVTQDGTTGFTYTLDLDADPGAGTVTDATAKRIPAFDYDTYYSLPSDFLRLVRTDDMRFPHRIEENSLFATDATTPGIVYVRQVTDESEIPRYVAEAIHLKLAAELALTLKASMSEKQMFEQKYDRALDEARYYDSIQGPTERLAGDTWLDAHRNGGSGFITVEQHERWLNT